jgi:RimJ/RimL family protein N-acetyltransferase
LEGAWVDLEPLDPGSHGPGLWAALETAPEEIWTYMTFGPFAGYDEFEAMLRSIADPDDWSAYAIVVGGRPLGFAAYLRINPRDGVIEIGSIVFSPALQRTTAATEAIFEMIRHVFDLGYRRCEWKCDALNGPSRRAADRFGFTFEGVFRQATHYKGRNRDTAWYAIIDREWPPLAYAFTNWLAEDNFDDEGRQKSTIEEMRSK